MSKYNHNRRVSKLGKKALHHRRWYLNVGDGAKLVGKSSNPNDQGGRYETINRHYAKPGCRGVEVVVAGE
jgi:hypothetical protein